MLLLYVMYLFRNLTWHSFGVADRAHPASLLTRGKTLILFPLLFAFYFGENSKKKKGGGGEVNK